MKPLLNTLYVLSNDLTLSLECDAIVATRDGEVVGRYPFAALDGVVTFTYPGVTPQLLGACVKRGIAVSMCSPAGRLLARVVGESQGNVCVRRLQHRMADNDEVCVHLARVLVTNKILNTVSHIEHVKRLRGQTDDTLQSLSDKLSALIKPIQESVYRQTVRGLEGVAGRLNRKALARMIELSGVSDLSLTRRSRRPPRDPVNALLSFAYTLLTHASASALTCAGLDAYVGVMHTDRPGRVSLALDLMEGLRPALADAFVMMLIRDRHIAPSDFVCDAHGGVLMTDAARRVSLTQWQIHMKTKTLYPALDVSMPLGLVPHAQAQAFARFVRKDRPRYTPFEWLP